MLDFFLVCLPYLFSLVAAALNPLLADLKRASKDAAVFFLLDIVRPSDLMVLMVLKLQINAMKCLF